MASINVKQLENLLKTDLKNKYCIEINFAIKNNKKYKNCWMGKMPNKKVKNEYIFWYGLVEDGSESYSFTEVEDILNAKVFNGKSIFDIIEKIDWYAIDGCDVIERLADYNNLNK